MGCLHAEGSLSHLKSFKKFYYFDSNHYLLELELAGLANGLIDNGGLNVHDFHYKDGK